ncbi:MAG: trp operon repressor [Treponema sp.]|jgi:TrpR family trp operon transcriptional repressor|nr:trp operon repressor [Treponema sp.]
MDNYNESKKFGNESENPETLLDESFEEICSLIAESNDKNFIHDFFDCLFTPAERRDFANRWLLVKEIDRGTTQRDIAHKFGMSLCKITRGSKELHKPDSAFRKALDRLPG